KDPMYQRIIGEIPGVWMHGVDATEGGKELTGFDLQTPGQIGRLRESFFNLHVGFIVVVELEDNVGETLKVRINRTIESKLEIACIETPLLGIVIANFELIEMRIARVSERKEPIERDIHISAPAANGHRRGQRRSRSGRGNGFRRRRDRSVAGR